MIDKGRTSRILSSLDAGRLLQFYQGLNFHQRRARFGAAISNESIAQFCQSIDWNSVIIIGRVRAYCLEAVVEIHPLCSAWRDAEITMANVVPIGRDRIFAQLLQLAAFAAGDRGCSILMMLLTPEDREWLPLLADLGTAVIDNNHLSVDLGDYTADGLATQAHDAE